MGLENNILIEVTLIQKRDDVLLFVGPNFKFSDMGVKAEARKIERDRGRSREEGL